MNSENLRFERVIESLKSKSCLKQRVYRNTLKWFDVMKKHADTIALQLHQEMDVFDKNVQINFKEKGAFEFELRFSGDLLAFNMHSNVFTFEPNHHIHKTPYVAINPLNAYCGVINVYNFLADSYKYNRLNDLGYLVGRIFINHDNHFFVEGRRQFGFMFSQFGNQILTENILHDLVLGAMQYAIDFDLYAPPLESIQQQTLVQKLTENGNAGISTGKRLGYNYHAKLT